VVNGKTQKQKTPYKSTIYKGFICLAEQNMLHHKPPKFPKDKPIKHLGFKSAF